MRKFIRNLTSGFTLILLALLLELVIILFIQFFLDDFLSFFGLLSDTAAAKWLALGYAIFRVFAFIVAFIIFFRIINKPEDPEFKIPWIVVMLLMPLFASILYLIFGNHGLRKKEKRVIAATQDAYKEHFSLSEEKEEEYRKDLGKAYGTFSYLSKTSGLTFYKGNRLTYYKTGEEFFPALMEGLKQAKQFIFIEFFIITDGKLWDEVTEILKQKAAEGVDIRIVYDDMGCSGTISAFTPKRLAKYGIQAFKFHPFRPLLSGVFNNRDHRKIVVIDHQMAFTGGINLADEYANIITRFGYWKDTMVKIEGSAINNLLATFLQNFNICTGVVSNFDKYFRFDYPVYEEEGYIMPFGDGPGGIDDALIGEQNYINILNYASRRVYISTPYLIPTYELMDTLRNASLRGVEVHLIVPGIPDKKLVYKIAKSNFPFLLKAGVHIHIYKPGFNHMKSALADDELGFVGTINYDFRSLVHHFECGATLFKNPCLKDLHDDFEQMLSLSEEVPSSFRLGFWSRTFCALLKIFTPLL